MLPIFRKLMNDNNGGTTIQYTLATSLFSTIWIMLPSREIM